jgi:hypothetical protein
VYGYHRHLEVNTGMRVFWTLAIVLCLSAFFAGGCIFASYPGLQTDEVLFAAPLFHHWSLYSIQVGVKIPIMLMSYVGALKTWIYAPLFLVLPPSCYLIRIPALVIGCLTIVIFGALLQTVYGRRAALAGCVLLATDTMYLLTTVFDWGPVALQHLLLVMSLFLAVRWYHSSRRCFLACAAFCCGLAFWDKAVFAWVFGGILAGLLVYLREIRKRVTWSLLGLVVLALCTGALPLLLYNCAAPEKLSTVQTNLRITAPGIAWKFDVLRETLGGSSLFGLILAREPGSQPLEAHNLVAKISGGLHSISGNHYSNCLLPVILTVIAASPFMLSRRAQKVCWFSVIAILVSWLQMITEGGGGSAHHAVLLWPLPHIILAVGIAEIGPARIPKVSALIFSAILGTLSISNILVTNQYLFQLSRDGPGGAWTDAIFPLADGLRQVQASGIILADWGMHDSLTVLGRGRLPIHSIPGVMSEFGKQRSDIEMLSDMNNVWVQHTEGNEQIPNVNAQLTAAVQRAGMTEVLVRTFCDRHGRPVFRVFRLVRPEPRM